MRAARRIPPERRGEAGLTLLETLIAIAITAIIGAIILNLGARNADGNFRRAARALDVEAIAQAEMLMRPIAAAATASDSATPLIDASPRGFSVVSTGSDFCGSGQQVNTFASGANAAVLTQQCGGRTRTILADGVEAVSFAYSLDGIVWQTAIAGPDAALSDRPPLSQAFAFVRIDIIAQGGRTHAFVLRVGGGQDDV